MPFRFFFTLFALAAITSTAFGQAQEFPTQSSPPSADQQDRHEARRVSPESYHSGHGPTIKEAVLKKLHKANEAEVELAKMAQQQTDNPEVRQLAQTIVQDHQALNDELEKCLHEEQRTISNAKHSNRTPSTQDDRLDADRIPANQGRTDGEATKQPKLNQGSQSRMQDTVPQELCEIEEKACDNALKMTKEMLGNYQGQDFDMAFLGQQLVAHTMMLAELKAIQSAGPEDLQEIAEKAMVKVEKHRDRTKELAKKLEDDRNTRG